MKLAINSAARRSLAAWPTVRAACSRDAADFLFPAGAETVFADADKLTVFGDYTRIRQVFDAQEQFDDQTAPVINV